MFVFQVSMVALFKHRIPKYWKQYLYFLLMAEIKQPKIPESKRQIKPQPGFQTKFLSSSADIAIGGGSAGGGKTFAELLEPTRHISNPNFNTVFFRRTTVQITNPGGLWDSSNKLYPLIGGRSNIQLREWRFQQGARVKFSHLEHENN